ncbi:MAG TPA: diacylglycerol kinase family protein [Gemmatimonadales bacterium]|nr:diacylglycerol kinase family protein [Gemmatimonadales bacterium]
MQPITVILNAGSGAETRRDGPARTKRRIEALFADAGRAVDVRLAGRGAPPDRLAAAAVQRGAEAVVAAGGDGTVSAVAGAVADTGIPMGVLPLGTLNHFAKDLGLPLDLDDAVRVVLAGRTRPVDAGEVNGRLFVNNSSIGVYPAIVRRRERYRSEQRMSKWLALLWATLAVLRRHPFLAVRVVTDAEAVVRRTPFVFVGNGRYVLEGFGAGGREQIDDGRISVYLMNASRRRSLLWLGVQVLLGCPAAHRELDCFSVREAVIETRRRWGHVSADGEIVALPGPLVYRVRPGALKVFVGARD